MLADGVKVSSVRITTNVRVPEWPVLLYTRSTYAIYYTEIRVRESRA